MDKYKEVLKHLEDRLKYCVVSTTINKKAVELSIKAISKQIPFKPEEGTEGGLDFYCKCNNYLSNVKNENIKYCPNCGQKLDWH